LPAALQRLTKPAWIQSAHKGKWKICRKSLKLLQIVVVFYCEDSSLDSSSQINVIRQVSNREQLALEDTNMMKLTFYTVPFFLVISYSWIYAFYDDEFMRLLGAACIFPIATAILTFTWLYRTFRQVTGLARTFWLLLGFSHLLFIAAQLIWYSYSSIFRIKAPSPNWADLFWFMQYALTLAALIYNIKLIKGLSFSRFIFNISILMSIAATLSYNFLLIPIFASSGMSMWAKVVSAAYPIFDLGLLFAVIRLYYSIEYSMHRKVLLVITSGCFIQVVIDSIHLYAYSVDQYVQGGYLDPLWQVPLLLNGIAGLYTRSHIREPLQGIQQPELEAKNEPHFLPYACVMLLLIIHMAFDLDSVEIGIALVMMLITARQYVVSMQNRNLLKQLQLKNGELKKSEERYRHLVEINPHATCVIVDDTIIFTNKAGVELSGASCPEVIIGMSIFEFVPQHYFEEAVLKLRTRGRSHTPKLSFEFAFKRLDGKLIQVETYLNEIYYNGQTAYLCASQDITKRKEAEKKIKQMAYYDDLTGLPNKALLHKNLKKLLNQDWNRSNQSALVSIDIDRIKLINDMMGYSFGDLFLKQVALRIQAALPRDCDLYRHDSDEFCIVLGSTDKEGSGLIVQQLFHEFSKPLRIENRELFTTLSAGISLYPADGEDCESLIRQAKIAMLGAKKQGGNICRFYNKESDEELTTRLRIENDLRKALNDAEITVHYQPKVNLNTGQIIGVEALVRWQHPEWGQGSPLRYITVAEETGLILPLGEQVLKEACMQMKKWHNCGYHTLSMSVNLSPRQLQDALLISKIQNVLDETGLPPQQLDIEVTESIMQNIEESVIILNKLKHLGVQISIDDFGTGYSSLSYLKHLPIDNIKIDKSFVDDITFNPKDEAIVKTIIDMGHHLQVNVTAEGIENEEQMSSLKELQCNVGQGYYFSKPLPAHEVELLFARSFNKIQSIRLQA
jgi:diguanylate cyclase (GGDEF)-like protein/PAS domain S-box-containing protein